LRILVKLDDNNIDERTNIMRCLKLIENILDEDQEKTSNKLMHVDNFIDWLLLFVENGNPSSENYLQSSELLSTIV
jgi:hemerythrin-like domain-containing protein